MNYLALLLSLLLSLEAAASDLYRTAAVRELSCVVRSPGRVAEYAALS